MKKIIAATFATGLIAAGLSVQQAYATPADFTAAYGCNSATFTNKLSEPVNVNYGTANSGDVTDVQVPAGKSVKVSSKAKNFGYTATLPNGATVGLVEWPGVDLTAKCTTGKSPTKTTSKAPTKTTKAPTKKGLAKTGV